MRKSKQKRKKSKRKWRERDKKKSPRGMKINENQSVSFASAKSFYPFNAIKSKGAREWGGGGRVEVARVIILKQSYRLPLAFLLREAAIVTRR